MSAEDHISLEGTLLMLDDATPHVAVPVQAIRDGEVVDTTLSNERGRYQFINLRPGRYKLRCQVLDGYVYYRATGESLSITRYEREDSQPAKEDDPGEVLLIEHGKALKNVNLRFAPFKKGAWRNYTYLEGLADNCIYAIQCDPNGILWFATEGGGVSQYDGRTFRNFTKNDGLASNQIVAIYRAPDGAMWFGTRNNGVSRYDGKEFVNFTTEDGLAGNRVYAIHSDRDGVMWFGTLDGGVSRYDRNKFINFTTEDGLPRNSVRSIHCSPDGMMWFGTYGGGLSRYDGKEFTNFTTEDGLASNYVIAINHTSDGLMWFATEGGQGISRYDGKEFVNLTIRDGLVNSDVRAIHRDEDDTLWFGTFGGGVSRYDGSGFVNYTSFDGLSNQVHAICRDPDGILWFGTDTKGVLVYDEERIANFTGADGLADSDVTDTYRDKDGVMWFSNYGGISRYDGVDFRNFTTEDGLAHNWVRTIFCAGDAVIWFGTYGGGVSRYDGREFVSFTTEDGLANNHIYAIQRGPDGVMWFGTDGDGVSRYDGNEFVNFTTEDGLAGNWVQAIFCGEDGIIWFGTDNGISRYDGKEFVNFNTEDGLADNSILCIYQSPDKILWFGTDGGGVSCYDGKRFTNYTTEDGLANNKVNAIYEDVDGLIWFGTRGGGVSVYDGSLWTSLDTRDGLPSNVVQSIHSDADGSLWFATENGLTRYRRSATMPQIQIISVITDQIYSDLDNIPTFITGTRITIEYGSIDVKTIPEKRQYRHRIQAVEKSSDKKRLETRWNKPVRLSQYEWIPEKAGTYIFEVQAIDRDLNYSKPAVLNLSIQPDPVLLSMQTELKYLRSEVQAKYHFGNIIGRSTAIRHVRAFTERAIDSGLTVLITGETGTGKELVAKAIHYNSPRRGHPLLDRNCGAMPRELLASDLFGYRSGAFTGANSNQEGLFEAASGGTVLLDEISEMPEDSQVHLLRVLQERKVQRLGEHTSRDVDVRIIAMTNQNLFEEVKAGRFREDLYYRLSEFPIHIPPLRERVEDIPLLAEHFLQEIDGELEFAPDVFEMLQSYSWPGNVRELRNAIRRAAALAEGEIRAYHFPSQITQGESMIQEIVSQQLKYSELVDKFRRRLIEETLRESDGNRNEAARRLGIDRSNLRHLMKRLGIE